MATPVARFEEAHVKDVDGQWSRLTPDEFQMIPLPQRVQLIMKKQIRFFSHGVEMKALDALMD
jgi:hypothetical protein